MNPLIVRQMFRQPVKTMQKNSVKWSNRILKHVYAQSSLIQHWSEHNVDATAAAAAAIKY